MLSAQFLCILKTAACYPTLKIWLKYFPLQQFSEYDLNRNHVKYKRQITDWFCNPNITSVTFSKFLTGNLHIMFRFFMVILKRQYVHMHFTIPSGSSMVFYQNAGTGSGSLLMWPSILFVQSWWNLHISCTRSVSRWYIITVWIYFN